jgi:hypothetical protein
MTLNDSAMNAIFSAAVMQAMSQENKDALIKDAIVHLTEEKKNSWGRPDPSALKTAFNQAAEKVAYQHLAAMLENDEGFTTQIKAMVVEATNKVFASPENREQCLRAMVSAMVRAIENAKPSY